MSKPSSTPDSQIRHIVRGISGLMDDPEPAEKSLSKDKTKAVFLQVIDASYDGKITKVYNEFHANQNIYEEMKHLPVHEEKSARILDVTVHSDFLITGLRNTEGPAETRTAREGLIQFLQESYTSRFDSRRTFRWLNDPLLVNDIGSISSQWSQKLGGGGRHFYRLVNRTSLQQDPLDFDLHPRDSYFTCAQDENGRLIVIIVNDVWSNQEFSKGTNKKPDDFENPRSFSSIVTGDSWISFSDGSLETFAKLLVLEFFVASIYLQPVDYYEKLIYPQASETAEKEDFKLLLTKNPHLQVPLGLFEPRLSAKSKEAFREIEDAEGILRSVNNLVDSIKCVVETLPETLGKDELIRKDYEARLRNLKGLRTERCNNAQRALEALNRQLDYLTKKHSIREAKSIKTLTILASLYLPLSLSASLLGMSSPFKDIAHDRTLDDDDPARLVGTNLLFDFFGVFVTLATITVFIVYTIKLGIYIHTKGAGVLPKHFNGPFSIVDYGKRWRFEGLGGDILRYTGVFARWFIGGVFGITLLVIFLMGMLKNAQSAWDTAKWLFTAYTSVSAILILSYVEHGLLMPSSFSSAPEN
ncbi:hypothetical protein O1611_g777 [Lasiodiplodia mahajangana]|uniref:Uncharacterized protein n=1 Tax=Lasiodiplodia mahajangana TaxID=1108764 RepID=A0ACC2JZF0_9PEZI|nr:hypothetical protein O1611_g777 [Lasiodiplodia mahajangana]